MRELAQLPESKLRQLVIAQAKGLEAYFRRWPAELIPVIDKGVIRAVRALRQKEKANARSR